MFLVWLVDVLGVARRCSWCGSSMFLVWLVDVLGVARRCSWCAISVWLVEGRPWSYLVPRGNRRSKIS